MGLCSLIPCHDAKVISHFAGELAMHPGGVVLEIKADERPDGTVPVIKGVGPDSRLFVVAYVRDV